MRWMRISAKGFFEAIFILANVGMIGRDRKEKKIHIVRKRQEKRRVGHWRRNLFSFLLLLVFLLVRLLPHPRGRRRRRDDGSPVRRKACSNRVAELAGHGEETAVSGPRSTPLGSGSVAFAIASFLLLRALPRVAQICR